MFGVGVSETQAAVDVLLVPRRSLGTLQRLLVLLVGKQCRVPRLRRLLMHRIGVSRTFVLGLRFRIVLALEQDLCQQEVGVRGILLAREIGQVLAIPARRLPIVAALTPLLRLGVVVLCQVG